jgi:hypothetical protein
MGWFIKRGSDSNKGFKERWMMILAWECGLKEGKINSTFEKIAIQRKNNPAIL